MQSAQQIQRFEQTPNHWNQCKESRESNEHDEFY